MKHDRIWTTVICSEPSGSSLKLDKMDKEKMNTIYYVDIVCILFLQSAILFQGKVNLKRCSGGPKCNL